MLWMASPSTEYDRSALAVCSTGALPSTVTLSVSDPTSIASVPMFNLSPGCTTRLGTSTVLKPSIVTLRVYVSAGTTGKANSP